VPSASGVVHANSGIRRTKFEIELTAKGIHRIAKKMERKKISYCYSKKWN
jgi:hypothetical protein